MTLCCRGMSPLIAVIADCADWSASKLRRSLLIMLAAVLSKVPDSATGILLRLKFSVHVRNRLESAFDGALKSQ